MNPNWNDIATVFSIAGVPLTLLQWWRAEHLNADANSKNAASATVEQYLEWLRRKNEAQTLDGLKRNDEMIRRLRSLIIYLVACRNSDAENVLANLAGLEHRLTGTLETIVQRLQELQLKLQLFPQSRGELPEEIEFQQRYSEFVMKEYDRLRLVGMRRDIRQKTTIAYVSVRVRKGNLTPESQPAELVLLRSPLMTIRGPAGSGKTTLLRWLALQCSDTTRTSNPWGQGVPFFVPLRTLVKVERGIPRVDNFVEYTLRREEYPLKVPEGWIDRILKRERAVVLIDGVDELPPSQRAAFWQWLESFTENYPGNRICVSSRNFKDKGSNGELLWAPPASFQQYNLEELDDFAVRELIENWHDAVDQSRLYEEESLLLKKERSLLPSRLRQPINARIRDLCRNPLLCAMVCALNWQEQGDLPQKRVELYRLCCELLVETRDRRRDIQAVETTAQQLTQEDKLLVLQRLAWDMLCNYVGLDDGQQIEVARTDAEMWIESHIPHFEKDAARAATAPEVLDYLLERTNLLREPAKGRIDFPHRTFQEYLSACAAGALNQHGMLVKHAEDDQWRETIILAAGTHLSGVPFGETLVEDLIQRGEDSTVPRLRAGCFALALACCDTIRQIRPELKERVIRHIAEIVPPRDVNDSGILATAGESVLRFLQYQLVSHEPETTIAACARTLARIGSESAVAMLMNPIGYGGDVRDTVVREVCSCPGVRPILFDCVRRPKTAVTKQILVATIIENRIGDGDEVESALSEIDILDVAGAAIEDSSMLQRFSAVTECNAASTPISNLEFVAKMKKLQRLDVSGSRVSDIAPLAGKSLLECVRLRGTLVHDVSPLAELYRLKLVDLFQTPVSSIEVLERLRELQELILANTRIESISCVRSMAELQVLDIRGCKVTDLSPLASLQNIESIDVRGTNVREISCLAGLRKLKTLFVGRTLVTHDAVNWLGSRLKNCEIFS